MSLQPMSLGTDGDSTETPTKKARASPEKDNSPPAKTPQKSILTGKIKISVPLDDDNPSHLEDATFDATDDPSNFLQRLIDTDPDLLSEAEKKVVLNPGYIISHMMQVMRDDGKLFDNNFQSQPPLQINTIDHGWAHGFCRESAKVALSNK